MKKIYFMFAKYFALIAMVVATASANELCALIYDQPAVPKNLRKLRKF